MEIKYEAVFGPQELFIDAEKDTVVVVKYDDIVIVFNCYNYFFDHLRAVGRGLSVDAPVIAMRRIIRTPTWTVADQKAGKLPDVNAKVDGGVVVFVNGFNVVTELDSGAVIVSSPKTFLNTFKPIESPEEKAARLRVEWCKKAIGCAPISSEMQHYEMKRLGEYIGNIYDALLSGDLPVPVKE